ncbi:MAG: hypothetical protein GYA23_10910 [Methanomicrobiales archaeon]|nr:hypothetical protein [Methanomicrobiales archaeon]
MMSCSSSFRVPSSPGLVFAAQVRLVKNASVALRKGTGKTCASADDLSRKNLA